MSRRDRSAGVGFTLLELLIAVSLLLLLTGAAYPFLWGLAARQERLAEASAQAAGAGVLFDRLEQDLLTAVAGSARVGAGVVGGAGGLSIVSRGVELEQAIARDERALEDAAQTSVVFDAPTGEVRLARRAVGRGEPGPASDVVLRGVQRLRVRFHDGRAWRASFDSARAGGFPRAVEVAVWFGAGPDERVDEREDGGVTGRDDAPEAPGEDAGRAFEGEGAAQSPSRPPDRARVIVIPDAGGEGGASVAGEEDGAGLDAEPEGSP